MNLNFGWDLNWIINGWMIKIKWLKCLIEIQNWGYSMPVERFNGKLELKVERLGNFVQVRIFHFFVHVDK